MLLNRNSSCLVSTHVFKTAKKVLENNKVKEKGMIVLSSAYKGGGRTDLSCIIQKQLISTALHCAVKDHIELWQSDFVQNIKLRKFYKKRKA